MKKTATIAIVVSLAVYSCNSNKGTASSSGNKSSYTVASTTPTAETVEECPASIPEDSAITNETVSKNPNYMGGYFKKDMPTSDFQGASGTGTGSSHASNYYAREKLKLKNNPKKTCGISSATNQPPQNSKRQPSNPTTPAIKDSATFGTSSFSADSNLKSQTQAGDSLNTTASGWITSDNTLKDSSNVNTEKAKFDEVPW